MTDTEIVSNKRPLSPETKEEEITANKRPKTIQEIKHLARLEYSLVKLCKTFPTEQYRIYKRDDVCIRPLEIQPHTLLSMLADKEIRDRLAQVASVILTAPGLYELIPWANAFNASVNYSKARDACSSAWVEIEDTNYNKFAPLDEDNQQASGWSQWITDMHQIASLIKKETDE